MSELGGTIEINNTTKLPFKLLGTTCGAKLGPLEHCEDELVTTVKCPGMKGTLVFQGSGGIERAEYPLVAV